MARRSKYEEYVKPYLEDIQKWCKSGARDQDIATALGVALSTFSDYKNKYPELKDALRVGRQPMILNVKASLYQLAIGFEYEERKAVQKNGEFVHVEVYKRYSPPNERAAAMLLRNYDKDWKDKDNITTELKKQEQALREKIADANNWFGE